MVRISGHRTEVAVQEQQNVREREQQGADRTTGVPRELSGNNSSSQNVKLNTPPKLDYTPFGNKVKVQIDGKLVSRQAATAAAEVSRQAFNTVGDAARDVNNDMPEHPYIINYENFPKPEDYTQFGKNAFYQWKQDVEMWRDDRLEEVRMHKSNNLSEMEARINEQFGGLKEQQFKNFVALYTRFLITENTIRTVAMELKGDVVAIRNRLEVMRKQITAEIQSGVRKVNENTDQRAVELHDHLDYEAYGVHSHIDYATSKVHDHIEHQTQDINANTDMRSKEVKKEMQKLSKEIKDILEEQPSKEEIARETLKTLGITIAKGVAIAAIITTLGLPALIALRKAL